MNKKIIIGSIIAVVLLTLVSFSSVVGYSSVKSNPSNTIITDEYDSYTPIILVLQLIAKLRNHKDIQNVENGNDVLQIIEGDEELNAIVEKLKSYDCGCEDEYKPELERRRWWIVCIFLFPIWLISVLITIGTAQPFLENIVYAISEIFNCGF